jgi:hypothetical protein
MRAFVVVSAAYDRVEELLNLTRSFVARVLHMGNTAAPSCHHFVANVWELCRDSELMVLEGGDCATR